MSEMLLEIFVGVLTMMPEKEQIELIEKVLRDLTMLLGDLQDNLIVVYSTEPGKIREEKNQVPPE